MTNICGEPSQVIVAVKQTILCDSHSAVNSTITTVSVLEIPQLVKVLLESMQYGDSSSPEVVSESCDSDL